MKSIQLTLETEEINLILEGLGTQPYAKVYQLIQKIHQQAQPQINQTEELSSGDKARSS